MDEDCAYLRRGESVDDPRLLPWFFYFLLKEVLSDEYPSFSRDRQRTYSWRK